MAQHLIVIALGPVQEFIAQARRTRDLWFGSELLSSLAGVVARALHDGGAALVFPASTEQQGGANKIVATVDGRDEEAVAKLVVAARNAALDAWRDRANRTKEKCAGLIRQGAEADTVWEGQVDSFLEVNAVWGETGALGGYAQALGELDRALAARKGLREFGQWEGQLAGLPKSSLDGARQTVLRRADERDKDLVRELRIQPREQLDAVGLIKRAMRQPDGGFPPISNVALGPWIDRARQVAPVEFAAVTALCEQHHLNAIGRKDGAFPWEAQVFMRDRWDAVARERYPGTREERAHLPLFGQLRDRVGALLRKRGLREPHPYVACLMADGDDMGKCLRALGTADAHREFSSRLSHFASEARVIVNDHGGSLVYAGGDDVLAFVNVPRALACAAALREAFKTEMQQALPEFDEVSRPTLSVGVGVGHLLESMGHLRELGRRAEALAKQAGPRSGDTRRNALGVVVDRRSGATVTWRSKWDRDPVERLLRDVELLGDRLPLGKVFEVSEMHRRMPAPRVVRDANNAAQAEALRRVLDREAHRILARSGRGLDRAPEEGKELTPDAVGLDLRVEGYDGVHAEVAAWVERMQVAAMFFDAARSLSGEEAGR